MAFIEKGQEIDIEAIKAETRLSAETLQHKENRDQELADILQVRMIVFFWSLGLVRLIMKKQSQSMPVVQQTCRKKCG